MSIRIAGQVIASAGSLTAHNEDPNAHADIRELISQGGGSSEAKWGAITGDINAQTDLINLVGNKESEIRADVNEADSQLQAQITAQAAAIAEKQDKLTAGEGITIDGNVISATGGGGSAELPDNVYTQDNFIAGENVTITDVLPEGGIDEHTLACWHFDTDNIDVVNGISLGSSVETSFFKFAPGCSLGNGYQNFINLPFSFSSTQDFSFDLWYLRYASSGDGEIGFKDGKGFYHTMWFNINYLGQVQCRHNGTMSDVVATIPQGKWAHLYAHHKAKTNTYEYFIDGKKVYSAVDETLFGDRKQFSIASYYTAYKDEVRISDCIRWTDDFTPPTEPYTLATGPTKKAINAVIPEVELPDTVYTSENLVAGDNIKIKEVVNPNVIDDNTLLCWHFDGDTKDVVNGEDFTLYPGYGTLNTTYYKFGTASAPDYVQNGLYITLKEPLTDKDNFTLDYWIYGHGADTDTLSFTTRLAGGIGTTNGTSIYLRAFGNDQNLLDVSDSNGNYVSSLTKSNFISSKEWSHWAYTYNKDTREFAVYANGIKQGSYVFPSENSFNIEIIYPVDTNYNQFVIDEFRVTKSLAWDKNFTPPTEAYVKSDAPAKKAISAIIPPVELPSDVYRQTNLLGGKNIEIIPEPVEGGIDEHTIGMWHFDSSMFDEINNKGFSYDRVGTYIDGKFGKGVYSVYGGRTDSEILCETQSIGTDFTIDCVVLPRDTSSSGTLFYLYAGDQSGDYYGLSVTYSMIGGSVTLAHRSNTLVSKTLTPLTAADKPHLALQRRGNLVEVFIEGKKEIEYDVSSIATELIGKGFGVNSATWVGIDELRISNIARYDGDFTPPTQPYRKAEPTGNYVINFTGKASSSSGASKNIGEVYYSQSSLATDNAGALPLFTGETIASANTIYPDFYNWVESHTELQCTSDEYESALSTYGECPKYVIADGTLRLPKLANYIKMANTADGITQSDAGLPNITGTFTSGYRQYADPHAKGAIKSESFVDSGALGGDQSKHMTVDSLDASRSSEVYGKSDTVTPAHTTLYPWVCAYNEVIPESFANATQFIDALSGKADTNLDNIPSNYDYVVESYNDGTNWYRLYKSGWLEQGGTVGNGNDGEYFINFPKPFADTQYTILKTNSWYLANATTFQWINIWGKTTTSATTYNARQSTGGFGFSWYACGQGAEL